MRFIRTKYGFPVSRTRWILCLQSPRFACHPQNKYLLSWCWEEIIISDFSLTCGILENPPEGWEEAAYEVWRNSFGVSTEVWNGKNFGSTDPRWEGKHVEFVVGPMLCFEASCPAGKFIEDSEISDIVKVMFQTMFGGKRKPEGGASEVECNGLEIEIPDEIRLAKLGVHQRLASISFPIGKERAEAFLSNLYD